MRKIFNLFVILFLLSQRCIGQNVNWVSSTEHSKWVINRPIKLQRFISSKFVDAEIFPGQKQQTIEGWGGCFNELGWDALQLLNIKERESVLRALFNPDNGLKFNICRMPIGANDYARNWYSLDDSAGDFNMKYFNIVRDRKILIPYIHEAMKYNPTLKLWASPWSPPVWMKTNKHYANAPGDHNDLKPENAVLSGNQFIQEEKYLSSYALYLSKFAKAYQAEGINIYSVHFQNEPFTRNQWPNCSWTPTAMRNFITGYLGPTFHKEKLNTELWLGTWNNDVIENFDTVLSSPEAMKYIAGVGLQWEGKNIIQALHKKYPAVKLMQTESECGNGDFSWNDARHLFDLMKIYLDGGAVIYTYWNMVLADKGTSTWGWNQNALIQIDKNSRKVTYTPEYYAFKHVSCFVPAGSFKIECSGNCREVLAFVNTKNEVVVVMCNPESKPKTVSVKIKNNYFSAALQTNSFNTFTFKL
jgi:glucosylceramidase